MKTILSILLACSFVVASAQNAEQKVISAMKEFHQSLVQKNKEGLNQQTDKALSYGHSNGWIQTKTDLIADFDNGTISYQSFKEDSVKVSLNDNVANVRFIADIGATLRGNPSNNHLKVLEVWVKRGKKWILFARQAVR